MTATSSSARLRRPSWISLLAVAVVALAMAWPSGVEAKKHAHNKCPTAHSKGHKAKRKRCKRPVAKRHPRRSTTRKTGDKTTAPSNAEAEGCRQEQAADPEAFAETYGRDDAFETCVQRSQASSQSDSSLDDSADEDSG